MKSASLAIEALRHAAARGWRADAVASLLCGLLRMTGPRRRVAIQNLRLAFPDKSERELRGIVGDMYRHLGWMVSELLVLQRDPLQALEWVDEVVGEEYVRELLDMGKGLVMLTAHFGNWELFLAWGAQRGYPLYTISRGPNDPDLDKLLSRYRENCNAKMLDRRDKSWSTIGTVKLLKRGKFLAIAGDVHEGGGIAAPFMGRDCYTPTGAATFGLLADVPVIPYFLYRKAPFSHRAEIGKPILVPSSGTRERKIEIMTREMNMRIEEAVQKAPHLWFWLHKRWKQ